MTDHPPAAREDGSLQLERIDELDDIRVEWTALAAQTGNIFSTWEWTSLWWKHFGRGRTLLATGCRSSDGRLVGVLPLYLWRRRPFRIIRFIGHQVGDQLGPIYLADGRIAVSEACAAALRVYEADIFVGEHLLVADGWSGLLDAVVLTSDASPSIRFVGGSWDEFLAAHSANFRAFARRRERNLLRSQHVRYRLTTRPDELEKDLDALFSLHAARWAGQRTNFMRYEAFHRDFAAHALEHGWLRLWLLEVDGEPRAAWYGFRFGEIESFYQSGRDPAWNEYSVGSVVLLHSIREAIADHMTEYRFLRGAEPYKYRLADSSRDVETIGIASGLAARAALAAAAVAGGSSIIRRVVQASLLSP